MPGIQRKYRELLPEYATHLPGYRPRPTEILGLSKCHSTLPLLYSAAFTRHFIFLALCILFLETSVAI